MLQRSCGLTVWYAATSEASEVEVVGSWDGWAPAIGDDNASERAPTGRRVTSLDLAPGEYNYAIVADGQWLPDPNVPNLGTYDGHDVSWVSIDNCDVPLLRVDGVAASTDGRATITASFLASRSGDAIDTTTLVASLRDGSVIDVAAFTSDPSTGKTSFSVSGLARGKYVYTMQAKDTKGRAADDARATVWIEPEPFDPRDTM